MKLILFLLISEASGIFGGCNKNSCASPPVCVGGACYRNFDGSCNNVNKPALGMAGMPYARLCDDSYSDGKSAMPKSESGKALPCPRKLSYTMSPEKSADDNTISQLAQPFGQFIAHDLSMGTEDDPSTCCNKDKDKKVRCAPINIEAGDPVFGPNDTQCLIFARNLNTNTNKCHSPYSSHTPISDVTPWLDASLIYGNSVNESKALREFEGGRLSAAHRNGEEWLLQQSYPLGICPEQSETEPCYFAGDPRLNQSPQLTLIHIVFFREHNRLCKELSKLNPKWTDEKLFEEARRIVIAILQCITYNDYLQVLVGRDAAVKGKLMYPDEKGYVKDYDLEQDPSVLLEFATAAYRFYHSMVHGCVELYNEVREKTNSIFLRNSFNRPAILERDNNLQDLTRGLTTQGVRMSDQFYDVDITQFLCRKGNKLGSDLRSIDIQRARDHGLCRYTDVRKACGLSVPLNFCDLESCGISQENIDKLKTLYESVKDLELTMMGMLESIIPDTRAGPTFSCIIIKQFHKTRTSDRYFYQNGHEHGSFSLDQLKSIQTGSSMSRLFCDNVQGVKSMQPNAFRQITQANPLTACDELPRIDLQPWINKN